MSGKAANKKVKTENTIPADGLLADVRKRRVYPR
jgi:hypothetical protein